MARPDDPKVPAAFDQTAELPSAGPTESPADPAPQAGDFQRDVAHARQGLGDFYLFDRKDAGGALAQYAPAYAVVAAAAQADPDDLHTKRELSALSYRMGFVAGQLADALPAAGPGLRLASTSFFSACAQARTALAKADPRDTRGQIDVMIALGRLGRAAEVEKIAGDLLKQAGTNRRVLFQTACGLALASGGTGPAADRCRARAFEVLGPLVERGWKDRVGLETDPDLEPVRTDKRFADLLARLPK